jgi:Luciferase-like monooxygenase
VRIGITLPTFEPEAASALSRAAEADEEGSGIDGVFVFDHLWPIGSPARPALAAYPVLGAAAAVTRRLRVGTLVARVGLLPDSWVVESLLSLHELSQSRLVAALGVGDAATRPENEALGIAWRDLDDRFASLESILEELGRRGVECWVGARSRRVIELARRAAVTVNLWDAGLETVAQEARKGPTTWAGPLEADAGAAASRLGALREAGATWAIWGWPRSLQLVTSAVEISGVRTGDD